MASMLTAFDWVPGGTSDWQSEEDFALQGGNNVQGDLSAK